MKLETVVRPARRHDRFKPDEPADAVIDMHDEIAGRERTDFGQHVRAALASAALAHEAVAQNVLLADDGVIGGLETLFEADDGERDGTASHRECLRKR